MPEYFELLVRKRAFLYWEAKIVANSGIIWQYGFTRARAIRNVKRRYEARRKPWEKVQ